MKLSAKRFMFQEMGMGSHTGLECLEARCGRQMDGFIKYPRCPPASTNDPAQIDNSVPIQFFQ